MDSLLEPPEGTWLCWPWPSVAAFSRTAGWIWVVVSTKFIFDRSNRKPIETPTETGISPPAHAQLHLSSLNEQIHGRTSYALSRWSGQTAALGRHCLGWNLSSVHWVLTVWQFIHRSVSQLSIKWGIIKNTVLGTIPATQRAHSQWQLLLLELL